MQLHYRTKKLERAEYARVKAEYFHKKLKDKSISPEQAVEQIHADIKLAHGGAANTSAVNTIPIGGQQSAAGNEDNVVNYQSTEQVLLQMKPGDISPVGEVIGSRYSISYPEELNRPDDSALAGYSLYITQKRLRRVKILPPNTKSRLGGCRV